MVDIMEPVPSSSSTSEPLDPSARPVFGPKRPTSKQETKDVRDKRRRQLNMIFARLEAEERAMNPASSSASTSGSDSESESSSSGDKQRKSRGSKRRDGRMEEEEVTILKDGKHYTASLPIQTGQKNGMFVPRSAIRPASPPPSIDHLQSLHQDTKQSKSSSVHADVTSNHFNPSVPSSSTSASSSTSPQTLSSSSTVSSAAQSSASVMPEEGPTARTPELESSPKTHIQSPSSSSRGILHTSPRSSPALKSSEISKKKIEKAGVRFAATEEIHEIPSRSQSPTEKAQPLLLPPPPDWKANQTQAGPMKLRVQERVPDYTVPSIHLPSAAEVENQKMLQSLGAVDTSRSTAENKLDETEPVSDDDNDSYYLISDDDCDSDEAQIELDLRNMHLEYLARRGKGPIVTPEWAHLDPSEVSQRPWEKEVCDDRLMRCPTLT